MQSHKTKGPAGKISDTRNPKARPASASTIAKSTKPKKGFRFKALPKDAYLGKQQRLKDTLIEKAKLKKKYAKVLKDEGYLGETPASMPVALKKASKDDVEGQDEATQAPWLQKAVVDDWSADEDEEADVPGLAKKEHSVQQTQLPEDPAQNADALEDEADEIGVTRPAEPNQSKVSKSKTGKAPRPVAGKSEKRTGFQPYDASKRRTKFTSAEKEARSARQRQKDEAAQLEQKVRDLTERKRQRALATKREHSMTKRGQPRMGDRIKNLLGKLQGQI
jgi:hypothetical protein